MRSGKGRPRTTPLATAALIALAIVVAVVAALVSAALESASAHVPSWERSAQTRAGSTSWIPEGWPAD